MAKAQWVSKEKPNRKPDVVVPWHLWVLRETCASADSHWGQIPSSLVLASTIHLFSTSKTHRDRLNETGRAACPG